MVEKMTINTHKGIDYNLCGKPVELKNRYARVELTTTSVMTVDHYKLIHGGFVFGLADHAAMLAVNHPNVVLASASVKFLKPTQPDELLIAEANVVSIQEKKYQVDVTVKNNQHIIFEGQLTCFILKDHVLSSHKNNP
jgi:uncharacterized protein (TIGR00369 family)